MPQLLAIDRAKVRAHFEQRFSAEQMAREYVAIYERLCRRIPTPVLVEEPGLGKETDLLE